MALLIIKQITLAAVVLIFLSLTLYYRAEPATTSFIESIQHNLTTPVIHDLQFISNTSSIVSIGTPLVILLAGEFTLKKKIIRRKVMFIGLSLLVAGLITLLFKETYPSLRPFEMSHHIHKYSSGGGNSFPSGHSLEAFTAVTAIVISFGRSIWWTVPLLYTWALIVAISRVALGVHFPLDVLAGIGLGIAIPSVLCNVKVKMRDYFNGFSGNPSHSPQQ